MLYYLHNRYPEIVRELLPWEILSLMAYNWPGNVREIEKFGNTIRWQKRILKKGDALSEEARKGIERVKDSKRVFRTEYSNILYLLPEDMAGMWRVMWQLQIALKKYEINVNRLRKNLNRFSLSISIDDNQTPFKKLSNWSGGAPIKEFEVAYEGLCYFSYLFKQAEKGNYNLLDIRGEKESLVYFGTERTPKETESEKKYLQKIQKFVQSTEEKKDHMLDITSMSEHDLLWKYYKELLKKTGNNIRIAASLAGINEQALRRKIKKDETLLSE